MPCFREFLAHAKRHDGVWWATREEIARWYLARQHSAAARTPDAAGGVRE